MRALLTGGTGFVGAHLARSLLAAGAQLRCLVRPTSDLANLEGLEVDLATGDLRDAASLESALLGCDALFHCAADYRLGHSRAQDLYDSNVNGTRAILEAAARQGVRRVVYTSSVGALGLEVDGTPATEDTPVSVAQMIGVYKRSKFLAERLVQDFARASPSDFEVVTVNPSTPIGEFDRKPTPSGRIVLDYLRGRMPAYVDTGLNLIDVRDVAQGHVLAYERGVAGERYILGHENWSLRRLLDQLSEITGLPRVRVRLPHAVPYAFAVLQTGLSRLLGRPPSVSIESVRMSRYHMYFDASKAVRELGLPRSPLPDALRRAAAFYLREGYLDERRSARLAHLREVLS